jgi:hypothetical protein
MASRGRQSAAALAVVPFGPKPCPEPPEELTAEQAEIWRAVTATKPPAWFTPDSYPLLVAYCCLVTDFRNVESLLAGFEPGWAGDKDGLERYAKLLQLRCMLSGRLAQLATKMRLAQQSRYDEKAAAVGSSHAVAGTKPWQRVAKEA